MDDPADDGLEVSLQDMLYAFELAEPHAKGRTYKERLAHQQDVALGIIDWALEQQDRGLKLLEAESELALKRKSGGGSITLLGPFDLG